jgi:amidase
VEWNAGATGLSVGHVVSVSVRDSAAMLDAVSGPEIGAPYAFPQAPPSFLEAAMARPKHLRIAFSTENPSGTPLHEDVAAGLNATIRALKELGHEVFERSIQCDWRALYRAQGAHSAGHFGAAMQMAIEELGKEPQEGDLERLTQASWNSSKKLTAGQSAYGTLVMRNMSRDILAQFEQFDVFLCPVMIQPPPEVGLIDPVNLEPKEVNKRQSRVFGYTPPFNMTGQPSMSLPLAWSKEGSPIGMMFTGRYGDEATLLNLATQLEEAMPWAHRRATH